MNNIQKAFKNKAQRGLRMAIGGLLSPGRGNDLTRSRQMGEAADEMERTRLAEEADAAARRTQPPVAAPVVTNVGGPAQNPLDSKLSMGEAMAGLSNTERYKLGGSGTAAEASELGQRNDIMRTMRTAMGAPMQDTNPFKNLAAGGVLPPKQTSFGDRPMPPSTPLLYDNAPARPIPPRAPALARPVGGLPNGANRYMPAPEFPQERARPVAPAPTPAGTYPGLTGVVDLIRNRKVKNAEAMDYADGGFINAVNDKLRTVKQGLSRLVRSDESSTTHKTPPPARYSDTEVLTPAEGPDMPKRRTQSFVDEASRRKKQMEEAKNYEAGGLITPVNLGQGLYQAIAQPIAEDWRQGNAAIKKVRDQYPTADSLAGINPFVAAAQVANDVAAGNVGGDTAINVAQAVPVIKGLSGMAKMLTKQAGPTIGATKFVIDMPNTVRKNVALTTGQTLGQPANAFAAGGIVRGKGGPTDDEVPMSVGGTPVNLSPREAVLPVKTVMALGGPGAVEDLIERTNGKPPVRTGLRAGGNYAAGAGGKEDPEELMQRISRKYGVDVPPAAPVVEQPAPVAAPARSDIRGAQQGAYKAMLGTVAKPFAHAIDAGLNIAANAAGYDRPDTQAFVKPVNDYVDEGVRQVAPIVSTAGVSSQSIPDALGWKKRPDVPSSAPTSAVPVGQPQAPTTAVPVGQPQAPTTAAAAADIQARSMAAEGLRSGAQREMGLMPAEGAFVQRGNVGLRQIATNPAVQDALNVANEQQGTGVAYSTVKGADGKPQVMISGGPATKAQYIAADGTPTNDWTKTAQYAESKGLHARNKQALRDIEMENARGDMASALPFYQGRGLRTMAGRLREDEVAQKGQITPAQAAQLAMQREGLDATIANRKEDNDRAAAAARAGESENHRKATDDLIKSWATTDGKPDEQKYAFLQKYASQFERPQGMSSAEHLGNLMDNFAIDTMGDTEGRHWLSAEGTWNGERTKWQKRAAKDSLRRGAPLQSVEYHDPLTGRTIYQSDVNKLSPNQRKLFESRVYQ